MNNIINYIKTSNTKFFSRDTFKYLAYSLLLYIPLFALSMLQLNLLQSLLSYPVYLSSIICLKSAFNKEKFNFCNIFKGFKHFLPCLVLLIEVLLFSLVCSIPIILILFGLVDYTGIFIAALIGIVTGIIIIALSIRLSLAPFIIIDPDKHQYRFKAFFHSISMTKGHTLQLLGLQFTILIVNLIASIITFIIFMVSIFLKSFILFVIFALILLFIVIYTGIILKLSMIQFYESIKEQSTSADLDINSDTEVENDSSINSEIQ